ncbi:universal stress protein [Natrarchaeobaculum aegyptiacum]|uniref:Universal stress protein UspA n=1 Tax=Natrarchaeobaculum aegyptiacum TaxID=745377 RepID=A0A2Z2HV03_9EURY|nr:universal stress protein [Natrarchaeobaculum aegyptiacum]ARS91032.1 universal stress protein UspA [Natrarchaeobaculum aegyptiacum]
MPQHVLVPLDGSDHAFAGLEYSLTAFPDADISVLYVVDPALDHDASAGSGESAIDRGEARGEEILEQAQEHASEHGLSVDTYLRTGRPHNEILAIANTDVDHVVLGSHGDSPISHPFLGHVSEAVVRRAPVSTTLVPESTAALGERTLPGEILVPLDGSEQAEAALEFALDTFSDGAITAFHALSLPFDRPRPEVEGTYLEDVLDDREARAETIFESASEIADGYDASLETETGSDSPATAILERASADDVDQIVMGSHGSTLSTQLFTGSVAERVARRSPRTVTLVRGAPASE